MSLALLHPYAAMPFGAGSAEISTAPLADGTVYQAVQRAEDASDGKDAAFEKLITKMAKVVDDLLKEKAVSSQRIIQLESQREEAERASLAMHNAHHDAHKTQGATIIDLQHKLEALTKRVADFEREAFQKHTHDGAGPVVRDGTRTVHLPNPLRGFMGGATYLEEVPKYVSVRTFCQGKDS